MAAKKGIVPPRDSTDIAGWQSEIDAADRREENDERNEKRRASLRAARKEEVAQRSIGEASRCSSPEDFIAAPRAPHRSADDPVSILSLAIGQRWLDAYSKWVSFMANAEHRGSARGVLDGESEAHKVLRDLCSVLARAERCVFPEGKELPENAMLLGARRYLHDALAALFEPRDGTVWLMDWRPGETRHVADQLWALIERGDLDGGPTMRNRPTKFQAVVRLGRSGFKITGLDVVVPSLSNRQIAALAIVAGELPSGDPGDAKQLLAKTEDRVRKVP